MNKIFLLISVAITLSACNGCSKEVLEVPITIVFDHKLQNQEIVKNDSLYKLLSPFYSDNDSFLIVSKFQIDRIDLNAILVDSLIIEKGLLNDAQKWLTGGMKNHSKIKKNYVKQLEKKNLNPNFFIEGDEKYVDSFKVKNENLEPIVFSKNLTSYNWNGKSLKIFSRIDSILDFIKNNAIELKNGSEKYRKPIILFEPKINIVEKTLPPSPPPPPPAPPAPPAPPVPTPPTPPAPPKVPTTPRASVISDAVRDSRINNCIRMSGYVKINYFFNDIFRFVKETQCNTPEYKNLIKEIANILIDQFPNRSTISYNYSCSNENDFLSELVKYNIIVNKEQLKQKFRSSCPK